MAVPADMDRLRTAAAEWSLEGDRRLLDLLQSIHQKITSKCQETNSKLDEMVAALDDASVSLQNVNNRFMALSNTQFVESRVYEDDADIALEPAPVKKPQEQPKRPEDDLLKGLVTLEAMHEAVTILDSDSDSDEDLSERESVILKPKDLYTERPLPYIIGSQNWKNKWHAGLILEDSDTESTTSRHTDKQEQFSESDSDVEHTNIQPEIFYSMVDAEQRVDSEESLYKPQMTKAYKPYPAAATLFPEEPPPIDQAETASSSESDNDIFAELLRNETKEAVRRETLTEQPPKPTPITQKPNLFQEEEDENIYTETPSNPTIQKQDKPVEDQSTIKKPVGAISLFGSNKGAESIGAAILRRNQRKSSSDESEDNIPSKVTDDSRSDKIIPSNPGGYKNSKEDRVSQDIVQEKSKESSIFDELFAKSEKKSREEVKKTDLFSDIFDDIDDIFIKDVKKDEKKQSLFDDDLFSEPTDKQTEKDDLFKEPVVAKSIEKAHVEKMTKSNSIFDDDEDDFFVESNKSPVKTASKPEMVISAQVSTKTNQNSQKIKSIFDSDSDDGDIFSKIKPSKPFKGDKKTTSSNDNNSFVDSNNTEETKTEIEATNIDSGFNNAQANIVPITNKTDNNFETKLKPNFDKGDIFNSSTTEIKNNETTSNNTFIDRHEKASDDDWETDLPSNDEENATTAAVQDIEKPKIQEKPKVAEKPIMNTEKINESVDSSNTISNTIEKSKPVQEESSTEVKDSKEKDAFDEIFGTEEPPIFANPPTRSMNRPSATKSVEVIKDEIHSKNLKETAEEAKETPNQITKARIEDDIFDDLFNNPPLNKDSKLDTAVIFSDIPPPIPQKLKETKNTNINALFGDDSDDESLFFKSEPTMDDVPPTSDALDTIFHDEPPDFNIDFMNESKSPKLDKILPPNLSQVANKKEIKKEVVANEIEAVDETDQSEIKQNNSTNNDEDLIENTKKNIDSDTTDATKHIGKLKSMSLNINVNTLLPGASPKKSVSKSGSTVTSPAKTLTDTESPVKESKLVKSVSFDSDPDSLVLDNKISKERAKIQVKRRPSTRRARKEAVRKSGIDLVDTKEPIGDIDTSDNAGNITGIVTDTDVSDKLDNNSKKYISDNSDTVRDTVKNTDEFEKLDTKIEKSVSKTSEFLEVKSDKTTDTDEKQDIEKTVSTRVLNINNEDVYIFKEPNIDSNQASNAVKDSEKTKVEEIKKELPKKTLSIFDDEDDDVIFGNIKQTKAENILENAEVNTETDKIKEDLFKTPAKSGKRLVVTDDDEDIFSKTKKDKSKEKLSTSTKITEENSDLFKNISTSTKNNYKSFLDDDDDDLFAFTKNASSLESSTKNLSSLETSTKSTGSNDNGSKNPNSLETSTKSVDSFESGSKNDGVQTLGNAFKEQPKSTKLVQNKITGNTKQGSRGKAKSIFDDSSDEELFGGKKSKTKMADNLFSKGNDADLFSKKNPQKVVKTTLFDDEDGDDLFATKKTDQEQKSHATPKPTQAQEKPSKSQEIVFNDPLSMFDDD